MAIRSTGHTHRNISGDKGNCLVSVEALRGIVAGFHPEEIGLSHAWEEFYLACQAAQASPQLLQAIHEIKENLEDAQY